MSPSRANCSSTSSSSGRWSPTQEQVMVLHALYRSGLTKPNPSQVERITSQLSLYGRVQSKNVLYWFQNRKARDRKNLRNKLHQQHQPQLYHHHHQLLINNYYNTTPSPFALQLFNCFPQEVTADRGRMTWTADDLPKECSIETNGQDSVRYNRKKKPLETLELFPLRPTTV
ncbi:hypothetical protein ABFS82_14G247900 [Erythranthe guttata]|nr:PREDICTED: WUSCHEL-related homeobox 3-like [Erythranthe guttata]|eukprot:XP_012838347.1 PREDICTED: WUSCHEL-related homeobox 3-like [Erythranthe guttata]